MLKKFVPLLLSFSLVISPVQASEKKAPEDCVRKKLFGRSLGSKSEVNRPDGKLTNLMSPDKRNSADAKGPTFSKLPAGRRNSDTSLTVGVGDSVKPSYIMDPEALAALENATLGRGAGPREVRLRKSTNVEPKNDAPQASDGSPLTKQGRRKSGTPSTKDQLGLSRSTSGSFQSSGPNSPHKSPRTPGGSSRASPRDTPRESGSSRTSPRSPRSSRGSQKDTVSGSASSKGSPRNEGISTNFKE